jgi:hypothetical protein
MPDFTSIDPTSQLLVYYCPPILDLYGIPILIKNSDDNGTTSRDATIGGLLYIGGEHFTVTAGHVFSNDMEDEQPGALDEFEFSLEDDPQDGTEEDQFYYPYVDITSRGKYKCGGVTQLLVNLRMSQEAYLPVTEATRPIRH